jgi:DNA-binding CsgD family transcriptional regulator
MIRAFQELFERLGLKRLSGRRSFALEADLHEALLKQAGGDEGRVDKLAGELLASGLAQIRCDEKMRQRWQGLSRRQQDVAALTCLGFTNRQIAVRLGIAEDTVKSHMKHTLAKFQLHGKVELQEALKEWDFSEWEK